MITGDHKLTALAVAKELGIYHEGDEVLTGEDLDRISQEEFEAKVRKVTVYARVSPLHKLKIVEAWKKKGEVVAMTGDGVNDAPALKKSDIGVAMGITGTEVTKESVTRGAPRSRALRRLEGALDSTLSQCSSRRARGAPQWSPLGALRTGRDRCVQARSGAEVGQKSLLGTEGTDDPF